MVLDGDEELLLQLSDLNSDSVTGIVFEAGNMHMTLFLRSSDLDPDAGVHHQRLQWSKSIGVVVAAN